MYTHTSLHALYPTYDEHHHTHTMMILDHNIAPHQHHLNIIAPHQHHLNIIAPHQHHLNIIAPHQHHLTMVSLQRQLFLRLFRPFKFICVNIDGLLLASQPLSVLQLLIAKL